MGLVMLVQVKLEILRTLADYPAQHQNSGSQPFFNLRHNEAQIFILWQT